MVWYGIVYSIISNKHARHIGSDREHPLHSLLQPITKRPTETRFSFYMDHQVSKRVSYYIGCMAEALSEAIELVFFSTLMH